MKYAIYPFDYMRITQRHDEGNHLPHWSPFKGCSDKPWDEALEDGGRGYFVAKNDYKVVEKLGTQKAGYSVRLETAQKVVIPYQEEPVILELTFTHLNYDDWSKLYVNQIIKTGEKPFREGTSGKASGNHLHCTANIGKYYGFKQNGNGKWCFVYEKSLTPEEAFYVDDSVKILNAKGYNFKPVPFIPARGYFTKGDTGANVEKIDAWFAAKVTGNYFGDYTVAVVKEFQRQNGLEQDGNIGPITLAKMEEQGFEE